MICQELRKFVSQNRWALGIFLVEHPTANAGLFLYQKRSSTDPYLVCNRKCKCNVNNDKVIKASTNYSLETNPRSRKPFSTQYLSLIADADGVTNCLVATADRRKKEKQFRRTDQHASDRRLPVVTLFRGSQTESN